MPAEWSASKNLRWKTPLPGSGHSSPIVWGNRVFVTAEIEGEAVPGAQAVKHMIDGQEFKHPDAIADGKYVFAYFGTEGLYCYDFTGQMKWKAMTGQIGTFGMGTGTSPVLFENLVILQCDSESGENSFIVAFDKKTGKEVWKTPRQVQASWTTPLIVRGPQHAELGDYFYLMTDRGQLTCVEAKSGKMIYEGARLPVPATFTASPVAYGDKLLLTSEDGDTFVIKAGATHEVLGTNSIEEPVFASPAISNGMIFIRGEKNLYCIGNSGTN